MPWAPSQPQQHRPATPSRQTVATTALVSMTMTWKQTRQTGVIQLALQEMVLPQPDLGSGLLLSLVGSGAICEGDPLPTSSPPGWSSHPAPHHRPGFREGHTTHHFLQDIVSTGGSQGRGGPAEPSSPSPTPPCSHPAKQKAGISHATLGARSKGGDRHSGNSQFSRNNPPHSRKPWPGRRG